jgi:hypothetical protein
MTPFVVAGVVCLLGALIASFATRPARAVPGKADKTDLACQAA